jgi:hypothetical protein
MARHRNRIDWGKEALSIPGLKEDLPLKTHKAALQEMSINEIRKGLNQHSFNVQELEYLMDVLLMRISCWLNNKFYAY